MPAGLNGKGDCATPQPDDPNPRRFCTFGVSDHDQVAAWFGRSPDSRILRGPTGIELPGDTPPLSTLLEVADATQAAIDAHHAHELVLLNDRDAALRALHRSGQWFTVRSLAARWGISRWHAGDLMAAAEGKPPRPGRRPDTTNNSVD